MSKDKKKKSLNIILNIAVFISYFFLSSEIEDLIIKLFNLDINKLTVIQSLGINLVVSFIYIFILVIIYFKTLRKNITDFKKNFKKYFFFGLKWWLLGISVMILSNAIIEMFVSTPTSVNEQLVQKIIKVYPIYALISTVLIAPFTEEIIFRKSLRNIFSNNFIYILTSGLVFGFLHIISGLNSSPLEILYIIPYGTLGAVFAYLCAKTDNILVSIFFHTLHNFILVSIAIIGYLL